MLELNGVRSVEEFRQKPVGERVAEEELGKSAFLELMIAQISNQDPLEPAKNEAFIAQLAQFSSVEGIQNLNESMDSLVTSLRSSMTMDAAGLVGRNVLIPTYQTGLNTQGGIGGAIDVDAAVDGLTVQVQNSQGQVVHSQDLGSHGPGGLRFNWDGLDSNGEPVANDRFVVTAQGDVDGAATAFNVNLPDQIISVSIQESGLVVNLAGGGSVPAEQIKEIQ
jgi:flagellar basal-body rod modification protein FlgD